MATFKKTICVLEFNRDMKKLLKRFRTLEEDLATFIRVQLNLFHKQKINNDGIVQIQGLGFQNKCPMIDN
jgi:hypothetical protein